MSVRVLHTHRDFLGESASGLGGWELPGRAARHWEPRPAAAGAPGPQGAPFLQGRRAAGRPGGSAATARTGRAPGEGASRLRQGGNRVSWTLLCLADGIAHSCPGHRHARGTGVCVRRPGVGCRAATHSQFRGASSDSLELVRHGNGRCQRACCGSPRGGRGSAGPDGLLILTNDSHCHWMEGCVSSSYGRPQLQGRHGRGSPQNGLH